MLFRRYSPTTAPTITDNPARIFGYKTWLKRPPKKRALLAYLPHTVIAELRGQPTVRFSNEGIGRSWARVLNELDYEVDIISWDDATFTPEKDYELVVFHGGKNFQNIYPNLLGKPKIIHWLTGSYWKFNNEQEDKRRTNFKKRHGVEVPRDRYIEASEDPVNEAADSIIVLGDPSMSETYPPNLKVITVNNASYPDNHFEKMKKNFVDARHNFLFFAGAGNIHKGLDLAIDAFKELDEHLYIVTVLDEQVLSVFKHELNLPNIHLIGEVNMRTPEFYEVMDKCAFVILPSCSEGQAGSVVECMNQGLIPIVSKETRLDTRECGKVLSDCSILTIQKTVRHMAKLTPKQVAVLSQKTRQTAMRHHSPEYFRKELNKAILYII